MAPMHATRRITVERNRLRFAAAHMATFRGELEPLHGHNYDVIVEIEGSLGEDAWILDFGVVKRAARGIAERMDHKFLLQAKSKRLAMAHSGGSWTISHSGRSYTFPEQEVLPLPLENTTAECLSEWFAGELLAALEPHGTAHLARLTVGIEEMPGQTGWYTLELQGKPSH